MLARARLTPVRIVGSTAVIVVTAMCAINVPRAPVSHALEPPPVAVWPVEPPVLLNAFDPPETAWGRGHRGIDLVAQVGTPVRAIGPGRVAFTGVTAGKPVIAIEHPGGLRSSYEPVSASVTLASIVQAGDTIGVVADPQAPGARLGHCSARCLHLGLRYQGQYVDPMALLRSRAILLPQGQVP